MNSSIRKNISITRDSYDVISEYSKRLGQTFSEFLCESALHRIEKEEQMSLLEFLNANCEYVSDIEQKEIDELNIDYSGLDAEEMTLDELLQD